MARGNGGQHIFTDDKDRYRFYLFLRKGVEKFGHRIHAFCLMNNHVHLAIQVEQKPFPESCKTSAFGIDCHSK